MFVMKGKYKIRIPDGIHQKRKDRTVYYEQETNRRYKLLTFEKNGQLAACLMPQGYGDHPYIALEVITNAKTV